MIMLRTINSIFYLVFFLLCSANLFAQEIPSGQLFQGLGDLKKNVDRLTLANQSLVLTNDKKRAAIKDLQITYQKLIQENLQLENSRSKAQKSLEPKNQEIEKLKKELESLNKNEADFNQNIKNLQQQIGSLKEQDEALNNTSHQVFQKEIDSSRYSEIIQQKQKQKLALLKLIAESQDHQMLLQEKFLDYKKNIPGVLSVVNLNNKKAFLENQINQLQDEIAHLNSIVNNSKPLWGDEQMRRLEYSVSNLQKNKDELKLLLKEMQKKTLKIAQSKDKSIEQSKLQANIEVFKKEAKNLRIDLEELQQQMVDLDKRKSYLESLLQNP